MSSRLRTVLSAAFFLSGAAGLVYELAWVRRLALVFGSTTLAISTVLAAFMGGIALGAVLIGRYADRHADRALRLYGLLEIAIALYALAIPTLFQGVSAIYLSLPQSDGSPWGFFLVQFLLAGAVLIVPTALMGGTLPLLSRAVVDRGDQASRRVASLYGWNTAGAVVGILAANYGLLPFEGVRRTELAAAGLNLAAGLIALATGRRLAAEKALAASPAAETALPAAAPQEKPEAPVPPPKSPPLSPEARILLLGAALSGFAAMACEVAGSRTLALVLGSSVYSFGIMVLVFLFGISLGSALYARAARRRRAAFVFAATQVAATVAFAVAVLLVPRLPALFLRGFPVIQASFSLLQAWNFVLAAALLLPAAVFFGAAFPAAFAATSDSLAALGRDVGRVLAANTVGTVAGAFAAGFVLIPRAGLKTTLAAAAAATAVSGIAALRQEPAGRRRAALTTVSVVAALATLLLPPWPRNILTSGVSFYARMWPNAEAFFASVRAREVLFYKDGVNTTLSVERQNAYRYYASNGKTDASTDPRDMANQIYLGQLPMLLHPRPQDVFILGLGTGVSAAAVARYPVRSIEIVDIEPAAHDAARAFEAENRNLLADPRVAFVAADGRNRLLARTKSYDVIISDPSDVWVAGVGNLFTQEFYALARKRLRPNGVMVQWFHTHALPTEDLKLIVATFQFVFPYTSLWMPTRGDIILVGSADRVVWDWPRLSERVKTPGVSDDLLSVGVWNPLAVFGAYVCDGPELKAFIRGIERTHVDDLPILEYLTPRAAYEDTATANERALTAAQGHFLPFINGFDEKKDLDPQTTYLLGFAHASLGRTASAIKIMEEAVRADPGNARYLVGLGNQYRAGGSESKAMGAYRKALEVSPAESEAAQNLAAILRAQGDDAEAAKVLVASLAAAPDSVGVLADLARLLIETGRPQDALKVLDEALTRDPAGGTVQLLYGRALAAAGRGAEAVAYLRRARTALFDDAASQCAVGEALLAAGDLDEAGLAWSRAIALEPTNAEGYVGQARLAQRIGNVALEREAMQRARAVDPTNPILGGR